MWSGCSARWSLVDAVRAPWWTWDYLRSPSIKYANLSTDTPAVSLAAFVNAHFVAAWHNRAPGFKAHMMSKDLNIILDTAREYGIPLPSAAEHAQLFSAMLQSGMGDLDNSAVVAVIEALAGVRLAENAE